MFKRLPVWVVDEESEELKILKRFHTISEAEIFIANLPDKAKVLRGGYGIDAPEELLNPKETKRTKKGTKTCR